GRLPLTHVTAAGNTATAGTGVTNGTTSGSITTVGYDAAAALTASTSLVHSISDDAPTTVGPVKVADGATNQAVATQVVTQATFIGNSTAQLATLGDYGGPTKTLALMPGSPAIDTIPVDAI